VPERVHAVLAGGGVLATFAGAGGASLAGRSLASTGA